MKLDLKIASLLIFLTSCSDLEDKVKFDCSISKNEMVYETSFGERLFFSEDRSTGIMVIRSSTKPLTPDSYSRSLFISTKSGGDYGDVA